MLARTPTKLKDDTPEKIAAYIEKRKISYPVFHDHEGSVGKALGVTNYPRAFLLDTSGKVLWEGWFYGQRLARVELLLRRSLGLPEKAEPVPEPPPKPVPKPKPRRKEKPGARAPGKGNEKK